MITPNPIAGVGIHAVGGISAASCYLPFHKTKKWSWNSFWLVQSVFAWVLIPLLLAVLTVPDFFSILKLAPSKALWGAFLLGACYGFGGMSFGYATQKIGYSLTYTISIGLSAILGTIIPLMVKGQLVEYFSKDGAGIILIGMLISLIGIVICGNSGFRREKEAGAGSHRKMRIGFLLTLIAGFLSAIFNVSLEVGQPIADLAARNGAADFEGNAKLIVSTSGCFVVNIFWFIAISIKQHTLKEMTVSNSVSKVMLAKNYLWSALAGSLWTMQFFFYGLGHIRMGPFQFASWVIHMSMLIFFSFLVGLAMKEWKSASKPTFTLLIIGLIILCISFIVMTYGSMKGING